MPITGDRSDALVHRNYRRKDIFNFPGRRWRVALNWYKREYWSIQRAQERRLLDHECFDDFQDRHPRSVLWDAL